MINVPETLLALAAAAGPDEGAGVARELSVLLADACPYDVGDIVLALPGSFRRLALTGALGPACADDILTHVTSTRLPVRLDQLDDAEPFPDTRVLMRRGGFRSLLAIPFGEPGPRGALVLVRQQGWGLVGAPLFMLAPVTTMAGIAFERSLAIGTARPVAPMAPLGEPGAVAEPPTRGEPAAELGGEALELAAVVAERDAAQARAVELSAERDRLLHELQGAKAALSAGGRKRREGSGK